MAKEKYSCPYCHEHSTLDSDDRFSKWVGFEMEESNLGEVGMTLSAKVCPNIDCRRIKLTAFLTAAERDRYDSLKYANKLHGVWPLMPESDAKVLPDYVPVAIREDYLEACRIRDLSPKASATLSRRCLQGMIRDFWGVAKRTLKDEIDELQGKVTPEEWDSIDAVRSVGNIGAHMERDINVIVDVDPKEAQLLISLIEQLIDEWYVARESRKKRMADIKQLAADKVQAKNAPPQPTT